MPAPRPRVILHLDMDAFYAAVEVRDNPSLTGKPLIVGRRGRRGVVSTCSYEARRFGVHSAMPSLTAERLCPQAVWLPGRMEAYAEVSRAVRAILDEFAPLVEPLSIDEAFMDLTGFAASLDDGVAMAGRLKGRIRDEQRLSASVGVAANKFLAKVASDLEKPDGLVLIRREEIASRLWPLPVTRLWGVGPKTALLLRPLHLNTIGELAAAPPALLESAVGPTLAAHLMALAHGEDDRPVVAAQEARSISEERTYLDDLTDPDAIDQALLARAEGVARQLRARGLVARTIEVKVRTADFVTASRSRSLPQPTDLAEEIVNAARDLFQRGFHRDRLAVRLLGIGVSGLEPPPPRQDSLFPDPDLARARRLAAATDIVRDRFGEGAVTRARLARRERDPAAGEASSLPAVD